MRNANDKQWKVLNTLATALAAAHLPIIAAPTSASLADIAAVDARRVVFIYEKTKSVAAGELTPNDMFGVMSCLATYYHQSYPELSAACEYIASAAVALEFS